MNSLKTIAPNKHLSGRQHKNAREWLLVDQQYSHHKISLKIQFACREDFKKELF